MRWGDFYRAGRKNSAAFLEEEGSYCGIFSEAGGPVVSVLRLGVFPEKLKELQQLLERIRASGGTRKAGR